MKNNPFTRFLSVALTAAMLVGVMPGAVLADAGEAIVGASSAVVESIPESTTPADAAPVATEVPPVTEPEATPEAAQPEASPEVEATPEATEQPETTPEATQEPEATPEATEQPETTPEATQEPEATPEATEEPEATPEATQEPEATPEATEEPETSPEPTEEPETVDAQALLDELMALDDQAFLAAVDALTEEQAAALEALGEEALADYAARLEALKEEQSEVTMAPAKTYTAQAGNVEVTVKVPDGALPEGSQLVAELVDQTAAAQVMQQNGLTYDGFQALDVRFEYNGQEVEPTAPVQVAFIANDMIPFGSECEVYHFVEDQAGNVAYVEPVEMIDPSQVMPDQEQAAAPQQAAMPMMLQSAQAMSLPQVGQEESSAAPVLMAFSVSSFSTFTITWTFTSDGKTIELPLELQLLGDDGVSLGDIEFGDISITPDANNPTVDITDQVNSHTNIQKIQKNGTDYLYSFAAAGQATKPYEIESLNAGLIRPSETIDDSDWWVQDWTFYRNRKITTVYYYGVWTGSSKPSNENSGNVISYRSYTTIETVQQRYSDWNWVNVNGTYSKTVTGPTELTTKQAVYLVYEKQEVIGPDYSNTDAIHMDKTIQAVEGSDEQYELVLKTFVTGQVKEEVEAVPTDFVLVLDTSGSMANSYVRGLSVNDLDPAVQDIMGDGYYKTNRGQSVRWNADTQKWQYYSRRNWENVTNDMRFQVSRQKALQYAAISFVKSLVANDETGTTYRIALVSYANDASIELKLSDIGDGEAAIKEIKELGASGATHADYGLQNAIDILQRQQEQQGTKYNDRDHVVLFFTDGSPTSSNGFESSVANAAVTAAYQLKAATTENVGGGKGLGATVYSIGILDGADTSEPKDNTDGSRVNRFMHAVSSNYPDATSYRLSLLGSMNKELTPETIATKGYYQAPTNIEDLVNVFLGVAGSAGADIDLNAETVIKDVLTDHFNFTYPDNEAKIQVSTAKFESKQGDIYSFSSKETELSTASVKFDGDSVNVKGFDFGAPENMVVADEGTGNQLIIRIPVTYDSAAFGGNNIPSNTAASGVYVDQNGDKVAESKLKGYPIPEVNRPLNYKYTADEQTLYITQDGDIGSLLKWEDGYQADGINNQFINLVYEFKEGVNTYYYKIPAGLVAGNGSWYSDSDCTMPLTSTQVQKLMDCKEYEVTVTATPITDGKTNMSNPASNLVGTEVGQTKLAPDGSKWENESNSAQAAFHVLAPQLTAQDDQVKKDTTMTVADLDKYYDHSSWYDMKGHKKTTADVALGITPPTVEITATRVQGSTAGENGYTFTMDTDFILSAAINGTQLNRDLKQFQVEPDEIDHNNNDKTCIKGEGYVEPEPLHDFTIHVYATNGRLEITKTVTENKGNDVFTFRLTSADGVVYYYMVDLNGENEGIVTSSGEDVYTLPAGTYAICELPNQNYKPVTGEYEEEKEVIIVGNETATVGFTNKPEKTNIPTDNSGVKNVYSDVDNGGVVIWQKKPDEMGEDHNNNVTTD